MKRNLSVMIKPSSSKCNLNCKYCFYNDISKKRDIKDYGFMKTETIKEIINKAILYCGDGSCTIGFQGGEPLLRGIYFYKDFINYIKKVNKETKFNFFIQTNGTLINDEWSMFFKENNFLVGVSLDGERSINDLNRIDYFDSGTQSSIQKGIMSLKKHKVEFNILSVVTPALSKKIKSTYNYFKQNKFNYLQFIPCLNSLDMKKNSYSLSVNNFETFLKKLFDYWYEDVIKGEIISIRYFDNILGLFLGYNYESCDMNGRCSCQNIIESDGTVFPCDFYTDDKHIIGNINFQNFEEIHSSLLVKEFINESLKINKKCEVCKYKALCRNGCKKYRFDNSNIYCKAYYNFFEYSFEKFQDLAEKIKKIKK